MKKLVYFSASWCQPCVTFGPQLENITSLRDIPLEKINVDLDPRMTMKYHIKSIPTVVLVENDQEIKRFVGIKSENEILNFWN